ncbi:uncharacterized protein LOC129456204 [Periophthalmus magnuspinnatus]|uniref:uncharacterized protein LOC129456204 n=1 Tax=Periophthalmus magnuspinnatus TaxID=409849 RepID=UPI002436F5DB|nr:uncharacterized protein LOC129456204 [Periophthalmus magnuspinnatus]
MSQKTSSSSVVDPSEPEDAPCFAQSGKGGRNKSNSERRNEETSSSPESLNSDGNGSSKTRRRRKRTSNAESGPVVKVNKTKNEVETQGGQTVHCCTGLAELQSECTNIWFERSMYERAESRYQCWLATSSVGTLPSSSVPTKNSPPRASNVAPVPTTICNHNDQVACHHIVQSVWVNKSAFDQAERHFVETMQPSIPNSLNIPSPPDHVVTSRTPDEGYQSLPPTPATPVILVDAVTPTRQPINGLPRIPMELLRDVWLEKPQYDRAEAAFYQNQCSNNSTKRSTCPSTSRGSDHPQSLVEEEEEEDEEEEEELAVVEEKRVVSQCKAEVFHALHPIQEEEEPTEVLDKDEGEISGVCYFLHPDNERLWLDKYRYDAAETQFYSFRKEEAQVMKASVKPDIDASPVTPTNLQRDKYGKT